MGVKQAETRPASRNQGEGGPLIGGIGFDPTDDPPSTLLLCPWSCEYIQKPGRSPTCRASSLRSMTMDTTTLLIILLLVLILFGGGYYGRGRWW
jgi:hypothetical protein